jgi:hypothetical protein
MAVHLDGFLFVIRRKRPKTISRVGNRVGK